MEIMFLILLVCIIIVNIIYFSKKSKIIKELDRLEKDYNVPNRLRKKKKRKIKGKI